MAKGNTGSLIAIAALCVGGYMWWKDQEAKKASQQALQSTTGNTTTSTTAANTPPIIPTSGYDYPIIKGRYSNEAKLLQKEVGVTQDGIVGPNTLTAIRKFLPDIPDNFSILNRAHLDSIIVSIQTARAALYDKTVNA